MAVDRNLIQKLSFDKYINIDKIAEPKGLKSNRSIRIEINKLDSKYIINNLDRKKKINYFTFVYMIPFELFFDLEYIRYRLSNPKLTDLYKYHLSYYKKKYKKLNVERVNLLQQIFSVKNNHIALRLLGVKIKFIRKKKKVKKLKYSH